MFAGFPELFIWTDTSYKNHHRDISIRDNRLNIQQYHNSSILNVLIIIINYQGFDIQIFFVIGSFVPR